MHVHIEVSSLKEASKILFSLLLLCGCTTNQSLYTKALEAFKNGDAIEGEQITHLEHGNRRTAVFGTYLDTTMDTYIKDGVNALEACSVGSEEVLKSIQNVHLDMFNHIIELLDTIELESIDKQVGVNNRILLFEDGTYRIYINEFYEIKVYEFDGNNKMVSEESYLIAESSRDYVDAFVKWLLEDVPTFTELCYPDSK